MLDPTKPARAGNIYETLAAIAVEMVHGNPCVATIDAEGTLMLKGEHSPGFCEALNSPGYVGFVTGNKEGNFAADMARRMREAHLAVIKHGLVSE